MAAVISNGYALDFLPAKNAEGKPVLSVACKRTYTIDEVEGVLRPAEEQPPIVAAEEFFDGGDAQSASIQFDTELRPFKTRVDVVVHGTARAPKGKPSKGFEVKARLGAVERVLRIVGPRFATWNKPKVSGIRKKVETFIPPDVSAPEPILEVPLRFEYAFCGTAVFVPKDLEVFREIQEEQAAKAEEAAQAKAAEEETKKKEEFEAQKEEALKSFSDEASAEDYFSQGSAEGADLGEEVSASVAADGTQILREEDLAEARAEQAEMDEAQKRESVEGDVVVVESVLDVTDVPEPEAETERVVDAGSTSVFRLEDEGDIRLSNDNWVARAARIEKGKVSGTGASEQVHGDLPEDLPRIPYPANPVGMGFAVCGDKRVIDGLPLPLIEHPDHPITAEDLMREPATLMEPGPLPGGFGFVSGSWVPRSSYAGVPEDSAQAVEDALESKMVTLDPENPEERQELEAMLSFDPPPFQPRWYNAAVPQWQVDRVDGNEEVVLTNMSEKGKLFFRMPGDAPVITLDRGNGPEVIAARIDTCVICVDEREVRLVWRGHLPYGGEEELTAYPRLELAVEDGESVDADDEERPRGRRERGDGATKLVDGEDIPTEEELEAVNETEASKESDVFYQDAVDAEGTRVEALAGNVVHGDDSWIEEAQVRMMDEAELEKLRQEKDERAERKEKLAALKEQLAELQEADKKGKKKKKSSPKKKKS